MLGLGSLLAPHRTLLIIWLTGVVLYSRSDRRRRDASRILNRLTR